MQLDQNNKFKIKKIEPGENLKDHVSFFDRNILVKSGKIRILANYSGREETLGFAEQGDVFNLETLKGFYFIVSEYSQIVEIPVEVVNHEIQSGIAAFQKKMRLLLEYKSSGSENLEYSFKESPVQNDLLEDQTRLCLKAIMKNYSLDESILDAESLNDLESALSSKKINYNTSSKRWIEVLNSSFPLVLEDNSGKLHFIIGRKSNSLLEKRDNVTQIFVPESNTAENSFNVLKIDYSNRKKASKHFSLRNYFKLFRENKILTSQLILASVITQIFTLGLPIFYMVIFDRAFGRQNVATLDVMAVGMFLVMFFDLAVKLVRSFIFSCLMQNIDEKTSQEYLKPIFNSPLSEFKNGISQSFAGGFQELSKINTNLCQIFLIYSFDTFFAIVLVSILFLINFNLTLISLIPVVPMIFMVFVTAPAQKSRAIESMQLARKNVVKLGEAIENMETIRSVNANDLVFAGVNKSLAQNFRDSFWARFDRIASGNTYGVIMNAGSLLVLYFGAHEVFAGKISYGTYLAFNMMSRNFLGSIQKMLSYVQVFQETSESVKQLKLIEIKNEQNDNAPKINLLKTEGNITFNDIYFKYYEEAPLALQNINLNIKSGEKIVITGKSGAGKTTLLRLLQGLYTPTSGYTTLDNYNTADICPDNLKSLMGVVVQKSAMFEGTIGSNITLGNPHASAESVLRVASLVHLDKVLLKNQNGLNTKVLHLGSNLSGSQTAQISIARVLLLNPQIFVMDEITQNLDLALKQAIFNMIFEKYRNSTCIFVTDFLPVHQKADNIIVIDEGKIVEQGKYDALIKNKGHYYHLNFIQ